MWCCSSEFMVQGTWNPFSSPARRWQGIWPQIHLDSQQKTAKSQLAIWIRRWWSRYSLGLTGGFSPQRQKQMSSAFSRPLCQVWIISPVQFVFPLLFLLLPLYLTYTAHCSVLYKDLIHVRLAFPPEYIRVRICLHLEQKKCQRILGSRSKCWKVRRVKRPSVTSSPAAAG